MKNQHQPSLPSAHPCFKKWLEEVVTGQYKDGEWPWRASQKNVDIKKRFCMEGKKLGYDSRFSSNNQEFLYDFAWVKWGKYKRDKDKKEEDYLQEVILVMELEFSDHEMRRGMRGGIKYDFNKLLQADAPYKLMGFQMAKKKEVKKAIKEMKRAVKLYHSRVSSEIFVFGWAWGDGPRNDNGHRHFIFKQIDQKPQQ